MKLETFLDKYGKKMGYLEENFLINIFYKDYGETGLELIEPEVNIQRDDGTDKKWRLDFVIQTDYSKYAIECNGFNYHAEGMVSKERFDELQQKSNEIQRQGYKFVNLSKNQIINTPDEAIYELRRSFIADEQLYSIFLNRNKGQILPSEVQEIALNKLDQTRHQGMKKGLVVLATGLGKTYLGIFDTLQLQSKKILYIVHVGEVLKKARNSFEKVLPERVGEMGFYKGSEKEIEKNIIFASIQTLSKNENLIKFSPEQFDYIILDETHHLAAPTYKKVFDYFKPTFFLGLTATPDRLDQQDILPHYDNNLVFEMDQTEAIKRGYLTQINYHGFKDNVDYSGIKYNGFKYDVSDLNKLLMIKSRDEAIISKYKNFASDKKTIGFCVSTEHADWCAKVFNENGIKSVAIHSRLDENSSEFKNKDRDLLIKKFENNEFQAAFVVNMFNEGIDFPDVECLLLLRPTESVTILTQQIGRGLRISSRKEGVTVLDFIGNYESAYKILPALGLKTSDLKFDKVKGIYYYDNNGKRVEFAEEVVEIFRMMASKSTKEIRTEVLDQEWLDYGEFLKESTKSGSKLYWKVGNKNDHLNVHFWALNEIEKLSSKLTAEQISSYIKKESSQLFPGKTMEGTRALFLSKLLGFLKPSSPLQTTEAYNRIKNVSETDDLDDQKIQIISDQLEKFYFWNDIFSLTDRHTNKDERTPINEYFAVYPLFFIYNLILKLDEDYGYSEKTLTKFETDFFVLQARKDNDINEIAERIVAFRGYKERYELEKYLRKQSNMDPRFFKLLRYSKYFAFSPKKIQVKDELYNDLKARVQKFNNLLLEDKLIRYNETNRERYHNLLQSEKDLLDYHSLN